MRRERCVCLPVKREAHRQVEHRTGKKKERKEEIVICTETGITAGTASDCLSVEQKEEGETRDRRRKHNEKRDEKTGKEKEKGQEERRTGETIRDSFSGS